MLEHERHLRRASELCFAGSRPPPGDCVLGLTRLQRALDVADPWEAFAGLLRVNAQFCAGDIGVQQALARGPDAWVYAVPEIDRLRENAAELIVRAQQAGVMRQDFTVDDISMLMAGLSSTMAVSGYDWRRHLEIILAGIRAPA